MDSKFWDNRYSASELVWSATPNMWVEEFARDLTPGRAVDLAGGEGRNALWLAELGWQSMVVDFSQVGLDRALSLAAERLGDKAAQLTVQQGDLLTYQPPLESFDLVMVIYLQITPDDRRTVLRNAAKAVAPGGYLLVVAHDTRNLAEGYGGPQSLEMLYSPADVLADIEGTGVTEIVTAETKVRVVQTAEGERNALDAVVAVRRPS